MSARAIVRFGLILGGALSLAACQDGAQPFDFLKSSSTPATAQADGAPAPATSARLVEREVEAPSVFSTETQGLWDGRPSLGGVWVAYPSVKTPERVIIRNPANGKFVIGALFRRERDNPGPKLQVSADAASALGLLAGAPTKLSVVALRRQEAAPAADDKAKSEAPAPEAVASQSLPPAPAAGGKPPVAAPAPKPAAQSAPQVAPQAAAPAAKPAAALPKPGPSDATPPSAPGSSFVQLGIFSVEANARRAAAQAEKAGVATAIRGEESQGKTFWRVLAGPVSGGEARAQLIAKIKGLGFADAYAVSK